jgi:hypothetical protein
VARYMLLTRRLDSAERDVGVLTRAGLQRPGTIFSRVCHYQIFSVRPSWVEGRFRLSSTSTEIHLQSARILFTEQEGVVTQLRVCDPGNLYPRSILMLLGPRVTRSQQGEHLLAGRDHQGLQKLMLAKPRANNLQVPSSRCDHQSITRLPWPLSLQ